MSNEEGVLLIVDDDPELLKTLTESLEKEGHKCISCNNGQDALLNLRRQQFDLVVLDWTMPDFTGIDICRRLRQTSNTTPVLMLTARDSIDERVVALDCGADDYLTKPFDIKELHARVRSALRRAGYKSTQKGEIENFEVGDLKLDLINRSINRAEKSVKLSNREFELLHYMLKQKGKIQTREDILKNVWGEPFVGDPNTLDVYMGYLRKKLERIGQPKLLLTVRGVGYVASEDIPKN